MTTHPPKKEGRHLRRALRRLNERVHGGKHRESKCVCQMWEKDEFTRPGSMKGNA